MAILPAVNIGPSSISSAGYAPAPGKGAETFGHVMKGPATANPALIQGQNAAARSGVAAPPEVRLATRAKPGPGRVEAPTPAGATAATSAAKVLERVTRAQQRMDEILKLAETGKDFSPAELLALQAHVYRASQELDLAGKVVEKATNGVKQILQTQV